MSDQGPMPPPDQAPEPLPPPPPATLAAPGPLANWGDRVVAVLVDAIAVLAIYVVIWIVALIVGALSDTLGALVLIIGYLGTLAYSFFYIGLLEGETGQSPGKAVMGLKVVRLPDGSLLGVGGGIGRRFAHILDGFCFIGYLFPLFDPLRQTFADKIMSTVVLRDQQRKPFNLDLFVRRPTTGSADPPSDNT